MKLSSVLIFILLISTSITGFADTETKNYQVINGVLDLSGINLYLSDMIKLDGKWEFYWNRLLSSDDFKNNSNSPAAEYISVPGESWTVETSHPVWGYGTYRMIISGLSPQNVYSLYIPEMISNYRLWIDGKELSGNGQVSKTAKGSTPQFLPKTISFETQKKDVEIIIHISNYDYRNSGIWRSFFLGNQDVIRAYREKRIILETFLAGILLALSLFHIGIFIYRKKEKTEFLFGLICLSILIRVITTGEQLLTLFNPDLSWEIIRRLEYIPFYISAPLLALFLSSLFPDEASKIMNRIYVGVCTLLGLFIIIFPIRITNNIIIFAEALMVVGIVYILFIMIRAIIHKRSGSFLMMTAYVLFSLSVANDILYSNLIIQTMYVSPLGFVIFVIMQSQLLTRRFTKSFTQREILAKSRDKFRHASLTDSLTGLFNVRFLEQTLEKEMLGSLESGLPLSVIMADVDNFKLYNDTWGHKQGDVVLKEMAHIISTSAREKDSPCRYGGEEFSVVLPKTALKEAAEVAERIRLRFESAEDADKRMHGITVSIGVAQFIAGNSADALIERADKALYTAKHKGKNRVEMAE